MVQGKINRGRHTDPPAGRHAIRTNQCPPPPSLHIFYRPGAIPAAQPTASKHWRQLALSFSRCILKSKDTWAPCPWVDKPLKYVTEGQCSARPTVALPVVGHPCPLMDISLHCSVTEACVSTAWLCDLWLASPVCARKVQQNSMLIARSLFHLEHLIWWGLNPIKVAYDPHQTGGQFS